MESTRVQMYTITILGVNNGITIMDISNNE